MGKFANSLKELPANNSVLRYKNEGKLNLTCVEKVATKSRELSFRSVGKVATNYLISSKTSILFLNDWQKVFLTKLAVSCIICTSVQGHFLQEEDTYFESCVHSKHVVWFLISFRACLAGQLNEY